MSKVRTDQELVLATQAEGRIIVDINSIENGVDNNLKMMKIPPEIKVFKEKVNALFNMKEQQNMRGGMVHEYNKGPNKVGYNELEAGVPRRRGRPPRINSPM